MRARFHVYYSAEQVAIGRIPTASTLRQIIDILHLLRQPGGKCGLAGLHCAAAIPSVAALEVETSRPGCLPDLPLIRDRLHRGALIDLPVKQSRRFVV